MFFLQSCSINDPNHHNSYDNTPPDPPSGIQVLNGDNRVDLSWLRNRESDLAGYNIYYSTSYDGKYTSNNADSLSGTVNVADGAGNTIGSSYTGYVYISSIFPADYDVTTFYCNTKICYLY